ncbi:MAG: DUF1599 domain-containing protein [Deinococcales bacterium]|nr:DUF1599 domain-containing protein [Chitinophagaceae bacterium]
MSTTSNQYDAIIEKSKDIFFKKMQDYGTAWRVLRTISVVDQIMIKALRIRNIQDNKMQLVADDIVGEFKGIINYVVIGLIQLELNKPQIEELPLTTVTTWYNKQVAFAKATMTEKNHDYSEAWRIMSQESFVDLILTKLLRIKQILKNDGKTLISESIDANYVDILNYAVFALILTEEMEKRS